MQVTLNINNDEELRLHIKDAIKGQVLSISRDEIKEIVTQELNRYLKGLHSSALEHHVKLGFMGATQKILKEDFNIPSWEKTYIKPHVEAKLEETIKHWDIQRLAEQLTKEKVKQEIDKLWN